MRNPLQEQLLKAGLVKKGKVAQVVRDQNKQRQGKAKPPADAAPGVDVAALQAERAARDRALAAERNAEARAAEMRAQLRQLIEHHRVKHAGELAYRFSDGNAIRTLWIDAALRPQLAAGQLLIARLDENYVLVPRARPTRSANGIQPPSCWTTRRRRRRLKPARMTSTTRGSKCPTIWSGKPRRPCSGPRGRDGELLYGLPSRNKALQRRRHKAGRHRFGDMPLQDGIDGLQGLGIQR